MHNVFKIASKLVGEKKAVQIALAATNKVARRFEPGERLASHAMEYILCVQTTYLFCSECCEPVTGDNYKRSVHDHCARQAWQKSYDEQCQAKVAEHQAKAKQDAVVAQFMTELDSWPAQPQKQFEVAQTYTTDDSSDYDEESFSDELGD